MSNSNFSNLYTNFFFSKSFNLEKKSKLCCVISADLQIENIFLNIKLRTKFLKFITNNYSSGFTSNASFPNFLLTFNFSILLTFFEGKNIFSFFFFQHLNPSFIFGSSSTNRIFLHNFSTYFLKRFPTSSFFFINKSCNTDAVTFFNISKINNNSIKKASMAFTFHLYNNIFTNFILLNLNKAVTF